jgi:hypothetical protein
LNIRQARAVGISSILHRIFIIVPGVLNLALGLGEALIRCCSERDRLQAVRKVEQMNPALAAEALGIDLIRATIGGCLPPVMTIDVFGPFKLWGADRGWRFLNAAAVWEAEKPCANL